MFLSGVVARKYMSLSVNDKVRFGGMRFCLEMTCFCSGVYVSVRSFWPRCLFLLGNDKFLSGGMSI